jgi:hypothetical protein
MEHPDQEGFGEASLGEAQSSNPPPDPEMIEDDAEETGNEGDVEEQTGSEEPAPDDDAGDDDTGSPLESEV